MTDERKAIYWLACSGAPIKKQNALLEAFGSAIEVYRALPNDKICSLLGDAAYKKLLKSRDEAVIDKRLAEIKRAGLTLLLRGNEKYGKMLNQDEVNPPNVLYASGNISLLAADAIAIVGTRHSTDYGKTVANAFSEELSKKFVIVTGHATGIDTYAARAALDSGGSVIIVLACGHDCYQIPPFMQRAFPDRLLLLSEYPLGAHSERFMYPERNRLISGLAKAVVVVEAGEKSGALITAGMAAEQGRQVFAVPGSIFSSASRGVNRLLRNGATAVLSVSEIFEDQGVSYQAIAEHKTQNLTPAEKKVCEVLKNGDAHYDDIVSKLGVRPDEVSTLLTMMELEGIITKKASNYFSLQ